MPAATTTFVYGLGLISMTDGAGVTSYYLSDGLGSTAQLTDSAGAVTDTYAYDVFGAPRSVTGTTQNDFRYTAQQDDRNANRGLYYLRARAYDPALGRFLQQDPLPLINRYSYVGNNAANLADPSGECSIIVGLRKGGSANISIFGYSLWYHAYVVTADPITGEKMLFEGGPVGGHAKFGARLRAFGGVFGFSESAVTHSRNRKKTVYADATTCSGINAQLFSVKDAINEANIGYNAFRINSNSVASEFLQSIGLAADKPAGRAPGWGTDLGDFDQEGFVHIEPLP